jgi:hypothetical protein
LFAAIIGAAVLFDISRGEPGTRTDDSHETQKIPSHELDQMCFYSTFNSFKLKNFSDRFSECKLFLRTQSEFIQKYHNLKASQIAKLESKNTYIAANIRVHLVCFQKCLYRNPGDDSLPLL